MSVMLLQSKKLLSSSCETSHKLSESELLMEERSSMLLKSLQLSSKLSLSLVYDSHGIDINSPKSSSSALHRLVVSATST